jgi:hypothetical protein
MVVSTNKAGCRSRETLNDAHGQGPDDLIETHPAKRAIHPTDGCRVLGVTVFLGTMAVRMAAHTVSVSVRMRVMSQLPQSWLRR